MFCPACNNILDYKKTVMISETNGKALILCSNCFDIPRVQVVIEQKKDQIKEITRYRKA
jgi:RNase P subunit RPR2